MPLRIDHRVAPMLAGIVLAACAPASTTSSGSTPSGSASITSAAITAADLRHRVYISADDSMLGRKAGTPGNDKATQYIADELRRMGVQPGGENGSYFQNVPLLHGHACQPGSRSGCI